MNTVGLAQLDECARGESEAAAPFLEGAVLAHVDPNFFYVIVRDLLAVCDFS